MSQYGVKEIVGRQDNPQVIKYFDSVGFGHLKDETAWCSAFMNWVAKEAGANISGKLNARSWMKVGTPVTDGFQKLGDVVILWRESPKSWKGHVGIYIRETKNYIYILGGNQNNQVKVSAYRKGRLLGYRRLTEKI